jgi:hypothetical protein
MQERAQFRDGTRMFLQQVQGGRGDGCQVDALQGRPPRAAKGAVEAGLHPWAQDQAITGADEVDGTAHHGDAHRAFAGQKLGKVVRTKVLQPAPEAEVRRARRLCLQPDQVLDRVQG